MDTNSDSLNGRQGKKMAAFVTTTTTLPKFGVRGTGEALFPRTKETNIG